MSLFQDAGVERKPTVAVIGKVKEVKKPEKRDNGSYYIMVGLESDNPAPRRNLTAFLDIHPRWVEPGFNPKTIDDEQELRSYRRSIGSTGNELSTLKAIVGDALEVVSHKTEKMIANGGFDPNEFHAILKDAAEGNEVVFEVKQKYQFIPEEESSSGEKEFLPTEDFKVGKFYPATEDTIKQLNRRAEAARRKAEEKGGDVFFKVGWEEETD